MSGGGEGTLRLLCGNVLEQDTDPPPTAADELNSNMHGRLLHQHMNVSG